MCHSNDPAEVARCNFHVPHGNAPRDTMLYLLLYGGVILFHHMFCRYFCRRKQTNSDEGRFKDARGRGRDQEPSRSAVGYRPLPVGLLVLFLTSVPDDATCSQNPMKGETALCGPDVKLL